MYIVDFHPIFFFAVCDIWMAKIHCGIDIENVEKMYDSYNITKRYMCRMFIECMILKILRKDICVECL